MALPIRQDGPDGAPTIALVHAAGTSSVAWEPLIPPLPAMCGLRPDLPRHGHARTTRWSTLEAVAQQVLHALDERATHLAGVSLGAYVALHMLRLAPTRFETAVLSGIHPGGMPNRGMMKLASAVMSLALSRPGAARRNAEMLQIPEHQQAAHIAAARMTKGRAFRRATNDVVEFELPGGLDRVTTRVTIAAGGKEHPLIRDGAKVLAKAFPHAQTYVAEGLGHAWPSQDPAQFASLLRAASGT